MSGFTMGVCMRQNLNLRNPRKDGDIQANLLLVLNWKISLNNEIFISTTDSQTSHCSKDLLGKLNFSQHRSHTEHLDTQ